MPTPMPTSIAAMIFSSSRTSTYRRDCTAMMLHDSTAMIFKIALALSGPMSRIDAGIARSVPAKPVIP